MRKRLRFARGGIAGLAVLALMSGPAAAGGQDFSKIKVTMTMVSDGVYLITGAGGNIVALVGEAGAVLVDSQFAELHDKIVEAVSSVGKGPIRYILNTNWHYDHALGNEAFHKAGAVIIGQANCAARMPSEQKHAVIDGATPAYPAGAWPEVTFADSLTLRLNGEEIEALHFPGAHSDADALYRFKKANVIHTGDLFFSAGYPYIDIGNGGSIDGMIAAAERILALADERTKLIPGHGPLADRTRLGAYRTMLVEVRARVAKLIKDGRTEAEAIAAKPTADLDASWKGGMPPAGIVALVYRSLKTKN